MNKLKCILFLCAIMLVPMFVFCQIKTIYVLKKRYDSLGQSYINRNKEFKEIKLLGGYMIDGRKKNIDLNSIQNYLIELFPERYDTGVLCIDIESKYYQEYKKLKVNDPKFKIAEKKLIEMIRFVKALRPKIKVGIYNIPFRSYYPFQFQYSENFKLSKLLKETDIIFPSLYILYPDIQHGEEANNTYWKKNLDLAFDYADQLNKEVIPFIWYVVSPGNKRYGGELLNEAEIKRYYHYISNYTSKRNGKVKAIVWWEPSKKGFEESVKQQSQGSVKGRKKLTNSDLLIQYTRSFSK